MTALCELYGLRRTTGDQWLERDLRLGPHGLEERARKPGSHPTQTPASIVRAMLEARQRHPAWGAKTRRSILGKGHCHWPWPARSTGCDLLRRHGLVPKPRHRRHIGPPGKPTTLIAAPNEVWTAEFTGQVKTRAGLYGSPLTGADGFSRVLLGGQARSSPRVQEAKPVFVRRFKDCGWPTRIRTDPGVPFATNTRARRSQRSTWGVRLGLLPAGIEPGHPPQNGRQARLHRPLTADPTRPPATTRRAHQDTFDRVRQEFHCARPHEALDLQPPASRSASSPRQWPDQRPPREDPDRFEVRDVSANGGIRWHHPWMNGSIGCAGAYVGREEIDEGGWHVSFGPLHLGRLLERHLRIEEAYGRRKRHR